MSIAILGWGSLTWDPRSLTLSGAWTVGGPLLPLEFSRVSGDGRLTLVIDPDQGAECTSRYALSPRACVAEAAEDLREREGTTLASMGLVDLEHGTENGRFEWVVARVAAWCNRRGFRGVVWTDLRANFETRVGLPFTLENAAAYLSQLDGPAQSRAREYFLKALPEVSTPLRRFLVQSGWLDESSR